MPVLVFRSLSFILCLIFWCKDITKGVSFFATGYKKSKNLKYFSYLRKSILKNKKNYGTTHYRPPAYKA